VSLPRSQPRTAKRKKASKLSHALHLCLSLLSYNAAHIVALSRRSRGAVSRRRAGVFTPLRYGSPASRIAIDRRLNRQRLNTAAWHMLRFYLDADHWSFKHLYSQR